MSVGRRWQGHLIVDDYAGYKALFTQGVTELGCLAYARHKFFDLYAANQSLFDRVNVGDLTF